MQHNPNNTTRTSSIGKYNNTHAPLIPDKVNSTFWWQMQMNPDQRVRTMTGYSKMEGYREAKSKSQTLATKVMMFYKNGYFHRTSLITVYERKGLICNIEVDEPILAITREQIMYTGDSKDFETWLKNFQYRIANGIAPEVHLYPISR